MKQGLVKKVGIVIPVLNNFEGACELLASVKTHQEWTPYVMPQWRAQVPLAAAWNAGFDRAVWEGCDYILIANDDVVLAPYSIDFLIAELERLRGDQVILTSSNNILGALQHDPLSILNYEETSAASVADHPNYSCFLVDKAFFDKVGRFDEHFNPAWFEDNDSHRRIQLAGYRAVVTTAAPSIHYGSVTTSRLTTADSSASATHYIEKWGGAPGKEQFNTPYNRGGDIKQW